MNYNYIGIEGIIGSGKTSLAKLLAEEFNAQLLLESFEENPFLPSFYRDQERYSFPVEMSFLAERYHQQQQSVPAPNLFQEVTISDYLFAKCLIFARTNLKGHELKLYEEFFTITSQRIRNPQILLYLHLSPEQALKNIAQRGRPYEQSITTDYLAEIQARYFEYFKHQKDSIVLMIDTSELDFVKNKEDYEKFISILNQEYEAGTHRIIP